MPPRASLCCVTSPHGSPSSRPPGSWVLSEGEQAWQGEGPHSTFVSLCSPSPHPCPPAPGLVTAQASLHTSAFPLTQHRHWSGLLSLKVHLHPGRHLGSLDPP